MRIRSAVQNLQLFVSTCSYGFTLRVYGTDLEAAQCFPGSRVANVVTTVALLRGSTLAWREMVEGAVVEEGKTAQVEVSGELWILRDDCR